MKIQWQFDTSGTLQMPPTTAPPTHTHTHTHRQIVMACLHWTSLHY